MVWNGAESATIGCPLTETTLEVPARWRPDVQRTSTTEVVVPPTDQHRGAILVRGSDHPLTTHEALDDFTRLFELIGVPVPDQVAKDIPVVSNQEILPDLDYIDVNVSPFEVEPVPPRTDGFVLGYRLVKRNDAMCRIATAAISSDPIAEELRAVLAAVDTPSDPDAPDRFYSPATPREPPPPICKGWPVWIFPSCRPAFLPPAQAKRH